MGPDIINAPDLHAVVDEHLEGISPTLRRHRPAIRVGLRRALESHDSVRKARRRKSDPDWAQSKFADERTLYRFFPDRLYDWEIIDLLDELEKVAGIEADGGSLAAEAAAFFRGLSHGRWDIEEISSAAFALIRKSKTAALRAKRHITLRDPLEVETGPLVGTKCTSISEIARLGREAQNCLAEDEEYWESFASGNSDIWSLRKRGRLVAVIAAQTDGRVTEAFGPRNATIALEAVHDIAAFCAEAELETAAKLNILPDFAGAPLIAPRVVELGSRIALYAEWPSAVRIDLSGAVNRRRPSWASKVGPERILTLSFDPEKSGAETFFGPDDPRKAVKKFGRKQLRQIVSTIALDQKAPSLVQHRLLTLTA